MSQNMFKYFGGMIPGTKTQNLKFLVKNTPLRIRLHVSGDGDLVAVFQPIVEKRPLRCVWCVTQERE